jgi:cytochrome c oxidase subunit 3
MSDASHGHRDYYLPDPSPWPIVTMVALLSILAGLALFINGIAWGRWLLMTGFALFAVLLYGWFRDVVTEILHKKHRPSLARGRGLPRPDP